MTTRQLFVHAISSSTTCLAFNNIMKIVLLRKIKMTLSLQFYLSGEVMPKTMFNKIKANIQYHTLIVAILTT